MNERNLKQEREKMGWTLEFVGKQIGITKQSLHAIETGECDPSYKVLCKLEKLFKKNHKALFGAATPNISK